MKYTQLFSIVHHSFLLSVDMDFSSLSGRISLTPTNRRECFSISITDDDIVEIPEEFTTMLELEGNLPPAAVLGDLQATVVINSNDGKSRDSCSIYMQSNVV